MNKHLSRTALLALALLIAPIAARAQEIKIGGLEGKDGTFLTTSARTIIDWTRPAGTSGVVTTATVAWAQATTPCDGIFYVTFNSIPNNSFSFVRTAERGPFRAENGLNTVTLDPPVSVSAETYVGVRRTNGPESCGQVAGAWTRPASKSLYSQADVSFGNFTALSPLSDFKILVVASSTPSVRVSTIPVVGSVAGGNNSFFRSSLTLANPTSLPITGKLRFRAANRAGGDSDPLLAYQIPPRGTLNYADILVSMNQSGLGSLDILTTGSPTPIATARIFNDAGAAGTNGFSEEAVPAGFTYQNVGTVLIPTDLANFRLNIGVRSISAVELNVTIYDAAGQIQGSLVKSYPANYFEQVTASAFLNGATIPAGGKIDVQAYQKEFIVYGAVTDNRTNDPSMRPGLD
jgi:hypothetical protein